MAEEEIQLVELSEEVSDEIDIDSEKVPVRVVVGTKAPREHQRICNKMGLSSGTLISAHGLQKYLQDNGYEMYPMESVRKYMNKKAAEEKLGRYQGRYRRVARWRWTPLRKSQAGEERRYYRKTVPVEVLMTAEKIFNDLGDRVIFEVTEIYVDTVRNGDPFLSVTAAGRARFVIERWDEPAFRR